MADAFNNWLEWYRDCFPDISTADIYVFRRIYYSGAIAAIHQLNAGRYLATATFLNSTIYENEGLTEMEKIQQADAMLDGGYSWPEGYPTASPFGLKVPK